MNAVCSTFALSALLITLGSATLQAAPPEPPVPAASGPERTVPLAGPPITLRIEPPPASVSDLRLSILAPSGQVTWECRPARGACVGVTGWYRGPGNYEMELSYRLALDRVEELRARQRLLVTDEVTRFAVKIWFWARYGASVHHPEQVATSLVVTQSIRATGDGPLVVVTPWRPYPASSPLDRMRNAGSLPINILDVWPLEAYEEGRWIELKRKCWRCGNAVIQDALKPSRPILPGEERTVGKYAEFGCDPPLTLGRYRRWPCQRRTESAYSTATPKRTRAWRTRWRSTSPSCGIESLSRSGTPG